MKRMLMLSLAVALSIGGVEAIGSEPGHESPAHGSLNEMGGWYTLMDFVDFGQHFGHSDCGPSNGWCNGWDFNEDGAVDILDFLVSAAGWNKGGGPDPERD